MTRTSSVLNVHGSGDIDSKYSSFRHRSERVQIVICDNCDKGYHNTCLSEEGLFQFTIDLTMIGLGHVD